MGCPIMAKRAERLDEIGFAWLLVEPNSWESVFDRLVEYKRVHGNCDVPQHYPKDKRLGKWVNTQRTTFKRGKIQPDRKRQLDSIGFVWNMRPNLVPVR